MSADARNMNTLSFEDYVAPNYYRIPGPGDLPGSPLLEQLYRLERQPHDAIVGQLRDAATARMERAA